MSLFDEAREAGRYRELLQSLIQRELDVRYKNSRLGVAWSLANPIVRALILWAVFHYVFQTKVENYAAYVLAAFFPWTYFLTSVLDAGDSVSKQLGLVRKVYFPRELLPLATTIANLKHFLLSLRLVLLPLLIFLYTRDSLTHHQLTLPPAEILLLPVLVVMQTLLIGGISLFLSALNVFFEDVKFLTAVVLDLLFYAVPIMYFLEQVQFSSKVPPLVHTLFLLNPMTVILTCYRSFLLPVQHGVRVPGLDQPVDINTGVPWPYFGFALTVCVATFVGGYAFFNARKWRFVEQL